MGDGRVLQNACLQGRKLQLGNRRHCTGFDSVSVSDGKQIRSASLLAPAPGLGANLPQPRASARLVSGVEDAAAGAGLTNSEVRLEGGGGIRL